MIYYVLACALILGFLVLPILNAVFMQITQRMHQEEYSYTGTTFMPDDDRTWDMLNRMAEYEDLSADEPPVVDVPNLAEETEVATGER